MRPGLALVLVLMSASLPGCFTPDVGQAASLFAGQRLFSGPTGADVVCLSVALVEPPVGERSLNVDLWELIDEQALDSEQMAQLSANGFRIGRIGGAPPPSLQRLICSERSCAAKPSGIQLHAGNTHTVSIGPAWANCRVQFDQDGHKTATEFAAALCQLQIVPKLAEDGRVTLRITPSIKHGELKQKPVAVRTPGGELQWELRVAQDEEVYPWLAWELTVDANDTIVIGTNTDATDTLGQRCFIQTETTPAVQRLLVVRVGRRLGDLGATVESKRDGVPLAIQASLPE